MSFFKATGPVLLAAALTATISPAATAAPSTPAPSTPDGDQQPVTAFTITTPEGELTPVATSGLQTSRTMAAQAATDAPAALSAPLETDEFFVAGVTWQGDLPQGSQVYIRVLEDGQWLEWAELETEDPADGTDGVSGTEPYVAGGGEAVQIQVSGEAAALPADMQLHLTPDWPAEEVVEHDEPTDAPDAVPAPAPVPEPEPVSPFAESSAAAPAEADAAAADAAAAVSDFAGESPSAASRPQIVSRAGWGANESWMRWRPSYANLRATVVHHTAGSNTYTQAQAAGVVRGIYHYHAVTRGWNDIGYNFLIDKWGRIYEGRSGSLASPAGRMPVGAHAAPFNTGTLGVSVMGDYTRVGVPQVAMNSMADVVAWQFGRAGLDATARSGFVSPGTAWRGRGQNLTRVFGHRDVSATTCPGNDMYSRLGWLARAVNDRNKPKPAPAPAPAPKTDPFNHTGSVHLSNDSGPWADITYRFGNRQSEVFVGDWDGNGTDTLAIRRGATFYIYNRNAAGPAATVITYGRPGDTVLVGDWNGDGKDTFAVRRGKDYHVKNSISSGAADRVISYGRANDEVLVGDWDGNGTDTFAVRRKDHFHVKNTLSGGEADRVVVYGRPSDTVLVGDWDGNGTDTFAVRRGDRYHIRNSLSGGPAHRVVSYGRVADTVLVGDWDGNRTDTLGVYRP